MSKDERPWLYVVVKLTKPERARLDAVCGPGRRIKREAWVREALIEALDRADEARRVAR